MQDKTSGGKENFSDITLNTIQRMTDEARVTRNPINIEDYSEEQILSSLYELKKNL